MPIFALLKLIPLKVWLFLLAAIAIGIWFLRQTGAAYERGKTETIVTIQKGQIDAQERAEVERRKLDRGDRSGVSVFDRD